MNSIVRARLIFGVVSLIVTLIWCVCLPWISAHPNVRQRLDFLEERGIDPSAMFYTELDAMDGILDRMAFEKGG